MKFLLVSDIHKSLGYHRGHNEMIAVEWFLSIIDYIKPNAVICAGDWGEYMTIEDFNAITSKVTLITVYGNHENFPVIKMFALQDGKVIEIGGLKIAGINGLLGKKGREYEINPNRLTRIIKKIKDSVEKLDVFVTHQPPYIPEVYPMMRDDGYGRIMREAIEDLKPKLFLNGHMTDGCYTYYEFPFGTKYLRLDSSQSFRCYGILDSESGEIIIYEDGNKVLQFKIT